MSIHTKVLTTIAILLSTPAMSQDLAVTTQVLETPSYVITITSHCEDGVVGCGGYEEYNGVNRKTNASIHLKGIDVMHYCLADQGDGPGKTPCHHLGYQFVKGNVVYFVGDDGLLEVTHRKTVLLREQGKWQDSE